MSYNDLYKGRYSQQGNAYFVTTNLADRKTALFADFICARIVINTIKTLDDARLTSSIAWVVMPDHVHWLLILNGDAELSEVIRTMKGRSALLLNRHTQRQGKIWQKGFFDHGIRKTEDMKAIAQYIIANPLRAGLVNTVRNYPHWDAIWL